MHRLAPRAMALNPKTLAASHAARIMAVDSMMAAAEREVVEFFVLEESAEHHGAELSISLAWGGPCRSVSCAIWAVE